MGPSPRLVKGACASQLVCLQPCALWYNMREEVTVYINGEPFVLREDGRPFKNMEVFPILQGL